MPPSAEAKREVRGQQARLFVQRLQKIEAALLVAVDTGKIEDETISELNKLARNVESAANCHRLLDKLDAEVAAGKQLVVGRTGDVVTITVVESNQTDCRPPTGSPGQPPASAGSSDEDRRSPPG